MVFGWVLRGFAIADRACFHQHGISLACRLTPPLHALQSPFEPASDAAAAIPPAPASTLSAAGSQLGASLDAGDDDGDEECEQQAFRGAGGSRCPSVDRQRRMSAGPDSVHWNAMQVCTRHTPEQSVSEIYCDQFICP